MKYIKGNAACELLGVCHNTLRKLADDGRIETIRVSGQRRYNVETYLGLQQQQSTICYCRVSSHKQQDDLERQISFMQEHYPQAEIVKDIGSGLNFKRKGLKAILERAMRGDKLILVVAHRDRLARFGHDVIRQVIEFNGGKLVVLSEDSLSPKQELTKDLLNILHVFSCRMHELRHYKQQVSEAVSNPTAGK
ncbi:IS607 family transposase [Thiothrix fructosivorans]|jgi:predicted site-specific integrase-resolvase|uniref:IS607 family transposase n=1 Tax=Thiothrix fructosivorans TaxID=111770 RepID=A0A8B0SIM0_9GAMM|nr:IS607 family transposase [Thiothrix fructosivorans]MBO0613723.1 IS607 family transposase [Thiothrix fructosivorans]QTX10864.1 IS607 family transposase [Thiothrix fructosivorans]